MVGSIGYASEGFFEEMFMVKLPYSPKMRAPVFLSRTMEHIGFLHTGATDVLKSTVAANSSLLSDAAESVRSLEAIPNAAPFGVIEGQVAPESDGVDLSGLPVTARGHSESFTAVTDNDGRFHLRVPAGHYKLDFQIARILFEPA